MFLSAYTVFHISVHLFFGSIFHFRDNIRINYKTKGNTVSALRYTVTEVWFYYQTMVSTTTMVSNKKHIKTQKKIQLT